MILPLAEAHQREAGGKARGLAGLIGIGMNVPGGIVLIPEKGDSWKTELEETLRHHPFASAAVRSSALAEDGETASFAGQFETVLNCRTPGEIISAVEQCMGSADHDRVGSYREHFSVERGIVFPVVIQEMVDAVKSGVFFTANPVTRRADQWMISATAGTGEGLMAGTETGQQVLLTRNGTILQKGDLLDETEIQGIFGDASRIAAHYRRPMDLEWAMDGKGELFWLQARPVTTMDRVHLNELDGDLFCDNEVFTRGNIGEMMPGPVTPLTYSVFGRAIEVGLQDFYIRTGVRKEFTDDWVYFRMFYNHLFFSMTRMADIAPAVWLNKREGVEFAIMGETLGDRFGDYNTEKPRLLPVLIWNQIRQFRYLASGVKRARKLEQMARTFTIREEEDRDLLYRELDRGLDTLNEAYAHHYCSSSQSGTYQTTLMSILSGGKEVPDASHYRDAGFLMSDLNQVESADVVRSIEQLCESFRDHQGVVRWATAGQGRGEAPAGFREELESLLEKHGHRCVREAELREKSWEEEPEKLVSLIRKRLLAGEKGADRGGRYEQHRGEIFSKLGWITRRILDLVVPRARTAVARREFTKSLAVKVQYQIKKGYTRLAGMMVSGGLLDDADQVFFLTHGELGEYLASGDPVWKELAGDRRELFPDSFKLKFPDVCQGYPEPLPEHAPAIRINGNAVKGLPVSAGAIEARIRIIERLEDADTLEKGEIMVCQYTDVGWTPYFSLASGLVTEIGSPLSHGAVVAREYGIPAVVNAKGAMGFFETGERVLLDGATGVIRKIS